MTTGESVRGQGGMTTGYTEGKEGYLPGLGTKASNHNLEAETGRLQVRVLSGILFQNKNNCRTGGIAQ